MGLGLICQFFLCCRDLAGLSPSARSPTARCHRYFLDCFSLLVRTAGRISAPAVPFPARGGGGRPRRCWRRSVCGSRPLASAPVLQGLSGSGRKGNCCASSALGPAGLRHGDDIQGHQKDRGTDCFSKHGKASTHPGKTAQGIGQGDDAFEEKGFHGVPR